MARSDRSSHTFRPSDLLDVAPFRISAVAFDFDGTLTRPGAIDFKAIHEAVGCPAGMGLLEFLAAIDEPERRLRKEAVLIEAEMAAAASCEPNEGAAELLALIRGAGVPMAIITRNRLEAVERAFLNLTGMDEDDFSCVVTRDLPLDPKPSAASVLHVAEELGIEVGELLIVGDHIYDMEAGVRAGALTMFLSNGPRDASELDAVESDFVVDSLWEAHDIVSYGLPLPLGKLPAALLQAGLGEIEVDSSVLVGAAIGEDAAVLRLGDADALVLASDPVTLASDSMAEYLVLVNANDVAASGADPRWLLATLLFPQGSSAAEALWFMRQLTSVCKAQGLVLVGGHTETTDAVSRTVAVGVAAGVAMRSDLLDKKNMQEGDRILLTKGLAIEGTGLLARDYGARLSRAGIPAGELAESAMFIERISILSEARIARGFQGVTALHDVTEGGLATAVRELGAAGGRRLRINMESIPVYPQTKRACEALGLDPLGLIGSGSLLITCAVGDTGGLSAALLAAGIEVTDIGEVLLRGEGVEALQDGRPAEWPYFDRDELTRL